MRIPARLSRLCLLALLFASVLPVAGSASLNSPRPGRTLLTYAAHNGGICLIRVDGSHSLRLTPPWKRVGEPAWSPRGRYVAFQRFAGYDHNHDPVTRIAIADTRGHVRWTFGEIGSGDHPESSRPLWSPDGRHIVYFLAVGKVGGLEVVRSDGTHPHTIAGCTGFPVEYCPGEPAWTADGQRLAFVDRLGPCSPGCASGIFTARPDGSDRRLLVEGGAAPAFSPDSLKLVYMGPAGGIVVADADGSNPHPLTPPSTDVLELSPAWSPDSTSVAFLRVLSGSPPPTHDSLFPPPPTHWSLIVVARADGSTAPPGTAGAVLGAGWHVVRSGQLHQRIEDRAALNSEEPPDEQGDRATQGQSRSARHGAGPWVGQPLHGRAPRPGPQQERQGGNQPHRGYLLHPDAPEHRCLVYRPAHDA